MLNNSSHTRKKLNIWSKKKQKKTHTHTHFKLLNSTNFSIILIWQAPIVFFQKWCLSLLSIVITKLRVRVFRLTKVHHYFNIPPCIICTPCIIWFRHGTSGIFGLWAFKKYILLCVSNVHNKENAPLKQNRCIFLYIFVWNIFTDLYVASGHLQRVYSSNTRSYLSMHN